MRSKKPKASGSRLALICLFSALCAAGAVITIPLPIGPVPIVIQNLFVVLAGLILGPLDGGIAVALFLLLGGLGFPVFSGGRGGLAHFFGPTGGYLIGYLLAAILSGLVARRRGLVLTIAAAVIGFLTILGAGCVGLKLLKGVDWPKAFSLGLIPFILGDAIKCALASLVAIKVGPFADSLLEKKPNG